MEGVSIHDLAPDEKPLKGLPLRIVARLSKDYPEVIAMMAGGGLSVEAVLNQGPKAVELIIASGWGKPDDEKAMEEAGNLELPEQIRLVSEIITKTLGGGAGPFSELLKGIYAPFQVPKTDAAADDRETKIDFIKNRLERLRQKQSNSSGPSADSPNQKFGT